MTEILAVKLTYPVTPSRARVFLTTSIAPVYTPGAAVCKRVFVKSKGWPTQIYRQPITAKRCEGLQRPTSTADTPPTPPVMKDLICCTVSELAGRGTSSRAGASLCRKDEMGPTLLGFLGADHFVLEIHKRERSEVKVGKHKRLQSRVVTEICEIIFFGRSHCQLSQPKIIYS